jgi:hypothetical protein
MEDNQLFLTEWDCFRHGLQHRHAVPDADAGLHLHSRLQVADDKGHGRGHAHSLHRLCCDLFRTVLLLVLLPYLEDRESFFPYR